MFFIDYVALLLVNMTAGFVVLAFFLLYGLSGERKRWAAPFAMAGLVAFLCGLHMIFRWPLPGAYNSAFGETFGPAGRHLPGHRAEPGQGVGPGPARALRHHRRAGAGGPGRPHPGSQHDGKAANVRSRIHPLRPGRHPGGAGILRADQQGASLHGRAGADRRGGHLGADRFRGVLDAHAFGQLQELEAGDDEARHGKSARGREGEQRRLRIS